ncbi:hypothetical protein DICSQDRAFT_159896 [Dichomitus squalens LYAD-421 SS1]|uniref:uncharacterized protein n=1 Tax=Dichomitus squalens (strain LYAD-421) TaxID=732165 RepID=UPI0004412E48|nr:uncharacterized protein DICSQDRAFT_159896 [Dichomitus squalens LYAD-421 SS1]EJF64933.1 hypothetical protein DICSQDRAFT_159896 [Dichomitus squalens LYAD-421 SS1]
MLSVRSNGTAALRRCSQASLYGHRPYSSKVRAFPFVVSRERAAEDLSFWTSMFTGNKMFSAWLRRILPGLNIEALKPSRLQAVYLPTWIIDAEVTANALFKQSAGDTDYKKEIAQALFTVCTVPGYVFPPLSTRNLISPKVQSTEPVPWSEALRKDGADDVLCLPFSVTPLKLIEAARSMSLADATISNSFRFEPSSVEETMIAAYPILLPAYLAQFNIDTIVDGNPANVKLTSFMEASHNEPRIMVEVVDPVAEWINLLGQKVPDIIVRGETSRSLARFGVVRSLLAGSATLNHKRRLERWIDGAGASLTALLSYRERYFGKTEEEAARGVNWEDVRIRPFIAEEREANWKYMAAGEELYFMKQISLAYERRRENARPKTEGVQEESIALSIPEEAEVIQKHIENAQKKREGLKPDWLAQYELQQRLSTDPSRENAAGTGHATAADWTSAADSSRTSHR